MKKAISLLLILTALSLWGCGSTAPAPTVSGDDGAILELVDLTAMSSTMVYSQVCDIVSNPDHYARKAVRIQGISSSYTDPKTGQVSYAIGIADATACCSIGLPYTLKDGDYPKDGKEITVEGAVSVTTRGNDPIGGIRDAVIVQ